MYISPNPQVNHGTYFNLVRDIVTAAPSTWPIIEAINNNILSGDLYHALKEARKLVAYERKLLDHNQAVQTSKARPRRFSSEDAHGLDPWVDAGSHSNQVYADCVYLSAVENASKEQFRASVRC